MKRTNFYRALLLTLTVVVCRAQSDLPPGVVVNHISKDSGIYIGDPNICILPDGKYLACHNEFGPKSTEWTAGRTRVFQSADKGLTWKQIAVVDGQYWSNMFLHKKAVYLLGVDKCYGNIVIRKSTDNGYTWTTPDSPSTGLLFEGKYHGNMPVFFHNGRIWRGIEAAPDAAPDKWAGYQYAMVISAPENSDWLQAENWKKTNFIKPDTAFLNGNLKGWLEGNIVLSPESELLEILRVEVPAGHEEYAAFVKISPDGETIDFDPDTGFAKFSGGNKRFEIRYDKQLKMYWTIANEVETQWKTLYPGSVRNQQSLYCSKDLKTWMKCETLLYHPDVKVHGFQYIDFLFEGDDIIFVSRTAFDDETGGAHNNHDANFMTFHRIKDFRNRCDSCNEKLPERGICAHRGENGVFPENTVAGFREAVRLGVAMVELDVRLTKDNRMIIMHDETVDRTTDGKGKVSDFTFDEIRKLDAGIKKGEQFAGTKIPTFEEVLDCLPRNIWINVHCEGVASPVAAEIAKIIVDKKREHQAFLACGHNAAIEAKKVYPQIKICNMERWAGDNSEYIRNTIEWKCDFIQLNRLGTPEEMKALKTAGVKIDFFWAKDRKHFQELLDAGVDFPLVDGCGKFLNIN